MLLVNRGWLFPISWDKFDVDVELSDCNICDVWEYGVIVYVFGDGKTAKILKFK